MAFTGIAFSDLELFETLNSSRSLKPTYRGRWKSKGTIVAVKKVLRLNFEKRNVRYMLGLSNIISNAIMELFASSRAD